MALENPYAPPRAEVGASQPLPWINRVATTLFGLFVLAQLSFDAYYFSFLTAVVSKGDISLAHYLAMLGADVLLVLGTLLLVLRSRKSTSVLLVSAAVASGALLLGVWYQVITCLALALVGTLLSQWIGQPRETKLASPSEA